MRSALAVTVTVSWGLERFGFRILRERQAPILTYFIFTIVFSQFTIYLAELFFGTDPKTLFSGLISPVFLVGPIAVSHWDLKAILTTAILVGSLALFMRYSRYGRYMIAVSDNPNLAELYGIDTRKAYAAATIIAGHIALGGNVSLRHQGGAVPINAPQSAPGVRCRRHIARGGSETSSPPGLPESP